ncbi:pro-resilin-like [Aricia agestis]|uniref:pro-resilin-like n=1 Tax=Aricia agestis TaxID=91739 RepID=UPI001C2086E8|nr:pro-resilin-like [Aricia agestis]
MKIFILLSLAVVALGEPPVGDGYPAARSSTDVDIQKSLSFDYGVPAVEAKSSYLPPSYETSGRSRSFQKSAQSGYSRSFGAPRLSQTYGVPSGRNSLSQSYGPPNVRSSLSTKYGVPGARNPLSQEYGAPALRDSLSQEYGVPFARNTVSQDYSVPAVRQTLSEEYGVPSARNSLSQEYGAPAVRTSLSQEYGVPSARNSLSEEYGVPAARNSLSQEYGAPAARNSLAQEYGAPAARNSLSQEYGAPAARNSLSQEYGAPAARNSLSQKYGAPSSRALSQEYGAPAARDLSQVYGAPARSLSQQYGPPSARVSQEYGASEFGASDSYSGLSNSYGAPLQRSSSFNSPGFEPVPSEEYGVPSIPDVVSARFNKGQSNSGFGGRVSTQYGAPNARNVNAKSAYPSSSYGGPKTGYPEARSDLKTDAYASGYSSARSTSNTYLPPSMSSQQYGVPDQYSALSNQGYGYASNALDELLNEPASYDFGYKVSDYQSGSDFGHTETRQDNKAEGSYFVVLPDGTKQTVEYEADERGFKPKISVELVDTGYDDNAANIRSGDGPY